VKKTKHREISACPRCGSKVISGVKHDSAWKSIYLPSAGIYACSACGYEGVPILFDSEDEYEKFEKYVKKRGKPDISTEWMLKSGEEDDRLRKIGVSVLKFFTVVLSLEVIIGLALMALLVLLVSFVTLTG
jgi:hypothetical protein